MIIPHIQSDLTKLDTWCTKWSMHFSPSKCLSLSYKCYLPPDQLTLHDCLIPNETCVRDLGLYYSCTFNFSEHIALQVAKARKLSFLILRSFQLRDSRITVFKTHVRPLLEYCSFLFSNIRKCDSKAIESIQRKFSKVICSTGLSYRQRCEQLQLRPLWFRRITLNILFLFRLIYNITYSNSGPISFAEKKCYNLRKNKYLLPVPKCRTVTRHHFFLNRYSHLWNRLPEIIRTSSSLQLFKSQLHTHLNPESIHTLFTPACTLDDFYENGLMGY